MENKPMDDAAKLAEEELKTLDAEHVHTLAVWWMKHYPKAGHKRLGRVLIKYV